jgi:putative PIN family toxin of toxin-antitoxin system
LKYLTSQRISDTLDLMETFAEKKYVRSKTKLSRDPGDDFLLAFSKEHKVNYLVTGDKDLLAIKKCQDTSIVTFSDFLKIINI